MIFYCIARVVSRAEVMKVMDKKHMKILALGVVAMVAMIGAGIGDVALTADGEYWEGIHFKNLEREHEAYTSGIIGGVVSLVIGVAVAVAMLPNVFNDTAELEADSAGDLDSSEESLIGTWNVVIIAGIMLMIIGMVL